MNNVLILTVVSSLLFSKIHSNFGGTRPYEISNESKYDGKRASNSIELLISSGCLSGDHVSRVATSIVITLPLCLANQSGRPKQHCSESHRSDRQTRTKIAALGSYLAIQMQTGDDEARLNVLTAPVHSQFHSTLKHLILSCTAHVTELTNKIASIKVRELENLIQLNKLRSQILQPICGQTLN